jgi:NAD(P)-dependent dehydrogenase (short-subunit alcohol dehydrogenase family)
MFLATGLLAALLHARATGQGTGDRRRHDRRCVSGVVAFLISEDAAWVTGQTVAIDGGGTLTSSTE